MSLSPDTAQPKVLPNVSDFLIPLGYHIPRNRSYASLPLKWLWLVAAVAFDSRTNYTIVTVRAEVLTYESYP